MADKELKSITFPGLPDRYVIGGTDDYADLEHKPQINGVTLSGNKTTSELSLGSYSKPSGGIPKTDLADAVQTSLGKADTALQSVNAGGVAFDDSATYQDGTVGKELSDQKNAISQKAPLIINTASGAIASFSDGADEQPIRKLVAQIEPVQEGSRDPSPDNVRPISGWTGAEIGRMPLIIPFRSDAPTESSDKGVTYKIIRGKMVKIVGTASGGTSYSGLIGGMNYVVPSGDWIVKLAIIGDATNVRVMTQFDGNNVTLEQANSHQRSITGDGVKKISWYAFVANGASVNAAIAVCLCKAVSEINQISVNWEDEAGTVYGGTLDVVTGELTVNSAKIVFDGTQLVGLSNWQTNQDSTGWLYTPGITPGIQNDVLINSNLDLIIADKLKTVIYGGSEGIYGNVIPSISIVGTSAWGVAMRVNDPTLTNNNAINAYLSSNPVTVIYKLATPIVYHLDPITVNTLLGNNTVYVDCGSVTVDYPADTGIVVKEQSNAISQKADKTVATTTADGLMSASDKTKLDDVYADYSSALTALGVI